MADLQIENGPNIPEEYGTMGTFDGEPIEFVEVMKLPPKDRTRVLAYSSVDGHTVRPWVVAADWGV